jgi:hypothetical protein
MDRPPPRNLTLPPPGVPESVVCCVSANKLEKKSQHVYYYDTLVISYKKTDIEVLFNSIRRKSLVIFTALDRASLIISLVQVTLVKMVNEASASIPRWDEGI